MRDEIFFAFLLTGPASAKRTRAEQSTIYAVLGGHTVTFDRVRDVVGNTPHMTLEQARKITDFIASNDIKAILELGFRFGVSTSFMADQLEQLDRGHITAIDLALVEDAEPGLASFLRVLGLEHRVTAHYEPTSYTWRLMKMLEQKPTQRFDFCYLDGAHDWFVDGFSFFLVDRLLAPGGWIVFDDVDWTFAGSPTLSHTERVLAMPEDERTTPQVRKIVELLVSTHPSYGTVRIEDDWAFVQKKPDAAPAMRNPAIDEVATHWTLRDRVRSRSRSVFSRTSGS